MSPTERLASITAQMSNTPKPSAFDHVSEAPPDALFGLMAKYRADEAPQKVDLGIGAYRDDDGKPWVLPVVRKVCMSGFWCSVNRC